MYLHNYFCNYLFHVVILNPVVNNNKQPSENVEDKINFFGNGKIHVCTTS